MIFNITDKAYLVNVDDEKIYIFNVGNLSYAISIGGPLDFRGSSDGRYKVFARENRYLPITDKEIAKLFAEGKEITEEMVE